MPVVREQMHASFWAVVWKDNSFSNSSLSTMSAEYPEEPGCDFWEETLLLSLSNRFFFEGGGAPQPLLYLRGSGLIRMCDREII